MMQILSAEQIRLWDEYSIREEPIESIYLMERAAGKCLEWLGSNHWLDKSFCIFCGNGNNGGDGLALARMLYGKQVQVTVYILESNQNARKDFQVNLSRLQHTSVETYFINSNVSLPEIMPNKVLIDALYGSGLNRPPDGMAASLIRQINESGNEIISIDLPSGMYADKSSLGNEVVKAHHTLSFQCYKPAMLVAENETNIGKLHILDIGLHPNYLRKIKPELNLVDMELIRTIYRPRSPFAHKGNFGHALLIAGSYGKTGAALLAGRACLRSGVGLLTCHVPKSAYSILQSTIPEAMVETDEQDEIISTLKENLSVYKTIGIGPGIGTHEKTRNLFISILKNFRSPIVIDADALNILAENRGYFSNLPPYSILTPHPKEFQRLFGSSVNEFERIQMARERAKQHHVIIVLKGHHTLVATPEGEAFFNSTGNAGMAKGGTGDALTGIITGLLAQGYKSSDAAVLGVFLHGHAGDLAAARFSEESMLPSDLIDSLGKSFLMIEAGTK
jgi:ADP-dependent NAD(P)H-hydrate dehydratase / NAD(P)H-hydrate epimerase